MKKFVYTIGMIAVLLLGLSSCKAKNKSAEQDSQATETIDAAHNSQNSLNWDGVYTGMIPCANCPGINVKITLNLNETYQISYQYIDGDETPTVSSGKFAWSSDGGQITLDSKDFPPYYKVGENKLFQLDMEGNQITGEFSDMYILTKKVES